MEKAVILGAKGMLGQALSEILQPDYQVLLWDKEEADVTDFAKMENLLQKEKPSYLFNCVAINAVDVIEEKEEMYALAKKINGEAVGELTKICKKLGIIFIHYSTDYVFDGGKKKGYIEEDKPDPLSKYGQTKLLGEKLLQENTDKYYLIRLSRLFGKIGTGGGVKRSFVDIMLSQLKAGKTELNATDADISCPTYALDLAKFTKNLLEQKLPYGIYHGANSGACTWYEWTKEIVKLSGYHKVKVNPVPVGFFPRLAEVPEFSQLLNTKAVKQRSWQEALKEYLKTTTV